MKYNPGDLVRVKNSSKHTPSGAEPLNPRYFAKVCLIVEISNLDDSYHAVICESGEQIGLYEDEIELIN